MYPFEDDEEEKVLAADSGLSDAAYVPDPRIAAYFEDKAKRRAQLEADSMGKNTGRLNQFVQGFLSEGDPGDEIRKIRAADSTRNKETLDAFDKNEAEKLKVLENREKARQYLEQKKLAAQARADAAAESRKFRREMVAATKDDRRQVAEDRIAEARSKRDETDIQKAADKLAPSQDIKSALLNVEKQLGFSLDDADIKDGSLVVGGKKRDLPGVSLPGVGRVSAYSSDARNINAAVSKIFNTELKDRSGAAVTSNELERLKTEFASGRYNTEPEMIKALKDYKIAAAAAIRNREAAFRPEILNAYRERGGQTSADFDSIAKERKQGAELIAVIAPNGKTKLIPKSQVQAAIAAGGKVANPVAGVTSQGGGGS